MVTEICVYGKSTDRTPLWRCRSQRIRNDSPAVRDATHGGCLFGLFACSCAFTFIRARSARSPGGCDKFTSNINGMTGLTVDPRIVPQRSRSWGPFPGRGPGMGTKSPGGGWVTPPRLTLSEGYKKSGPALKMPAPNKFLPPRHYKTGPPWVPSTRRRIFRAPWTPHLGATESMPAERSTARRPSVSPLV